MKSKKFYGYETEINKLAENHAEALLALYVEAFDDGMRVGQQNALLGVSVAVVAGGIGLCVAVRTYLDKKKP